MKNKVTQSIECVQNGKIPEPRARKFVAAVTARKKKREHARACAKRKRKATHGR